MQSPRNVAIAQHAFGDLRAFHGSLPFRSGRNPTELRTPRISFITQFTESKGQLKAPLILRCGNNCGRWHDDGNQ